LQECPIVVYFSSLDSPRSKLEGSYKRREGRNAPSRGLVLMIFLSEERECTSGREKLIHCRVEKV
jgi:hypothetical protein